MSAFRSSILAVIFFAAACGGGETGGLGPDPTDTSLGFQGTWVGRWGMGDSVPSFGLTVIVRSNHRLTVYHDHSGVHEEGNGSWTLDDGALLGKYAYQSGDTLFLRGALAVDGGRVQGTWGRGTATQGTYWGDKQ